MINTLNKLKAEIVSKTISNIIFWFLGILLILLPFNAIINSFFVHSLNISAVSYWKEIMFVVLIGLSFVSVMLERRELFKIQYIWLSGLIYLCLLIIHLAKSGVSLPNIIAFRLDGLIVGTVFLGLVLANILAKDYLQKLINWFVGSVFASLVLSLLVYFLLGNESLVSIGFRSDWSTYYINQGLAFCQRIEHSELCRFQGFLSGPNQMGAFLLMYLGAANLVSYKKMYKYVFWVVGLLALVLTFSRSAWLGFIFGWGLYLMVLQKDMIWKYWKQALIGMCCVVLLGIVGFGDQVKSVIIRSESNSGHVYLWMEGFDFWMDNFWFGNGLGSVGPASRYLSEDYLIPESWFLQVAGQFGVVGLVSFCLFYISMVYSLYKQKKYPVLIIWISLLIPLNLLHTFESASLVYALGIISGFVLVKEIDQAR